VQYNASQDAAKAADKEEDARQKSANLDALRRQRAVVREMQQQRALALSNATTQGASAGSGLQGAFASIQGEGQTNIAGIQQQNDLGNQVFAANRQQRRAETRGSLGEGISTLGGSLVKNAGTISSIGTSVGNSLFGT
jgi:hypothetical protein